MSAYLPVPVAAAAAIATRCDKDIVVIICWSHEHEQIHTTTFGRSAVDKMTAAELGEALASYAGAQVEVKTVYEDFRLDAARLKEENDRLKAELAHYYDIHGPGGILGGGL